MAGLICCCFWGNLVGNQAFTFRLPPNPELDPVLVGLVPLALDAVNPPICCRSFCKVTNADCAPERFPAVRSCDSVLNSWLIALDCELELVEEADCRCRHRDDGGDDAHRLVACRSAANSAVPSVARSAECWCSPAAQPANFLTGGPDPVGRIPVTQWRFPVVAVVAGVVLAAVVAAAALMPVAAGLI